jgi:hypothetical protein
METLEFATPVKGISWPDLILEVEITNKADDKTDMDKGRPFPLERERQLRTVISGDIKRRYPNRIYNANLEVYTGKNKEYRGKKVLMIRRRK